MTDEGVYLCEDTQGSYMQRYRDKNETEKDSFISMTKHKIDLLHSWHWNKRIKDRKLAATYIQFPKTTNSIHYYNGIVVFERRNTPDKPRAWKMEPQQD